MKVQKNTNIMMGFRLILLIMNIGFIINIDAKEDEIKPCTAKFCKPDNHNVFDRWEFDKNTATVYIILFEESPFPTQIAIINCDTCDDEKIPIVGSFLDGESSLLSLKIESIPNNITNKQYKLQITNRQDYENPNQRKYYFDFILPDNVDPYRFKLNIIDIDDVKPSIMVMETPCIIEENCMKNDCTFKVDDPDSTKITYKVDSFSEIFDVSEDDSYSIVKAVNKTARLQLLKELDFEKQPMYSFNVIATDDGGNEGSTLVIIKVKDVSDMPPAWMNIFATQTFKEHSEHVYQVLAKDGDIEVNAPINYKFSDEQCHKNITVNKDGEIRIGDIDRDEPEIADNTIKCTIIAYEDDVIGNGDKTESEIIFIVQDINDNKPVIKLKKTDICMNEGEIIQFDNIFSVNDIDQGANAQYDVKLIDDGKYSKAFQIIPSSGYRSWDFSITVSDAKLLDYDDEDWRNFQLTIHATDKGTPNMKDEKIIDVCLYNMNNNEPKFEEPKIFEVEIPENVKANSEIIKILAKDKDTDDYVSYNITMGDDKFKYINGSTVDKPITVFTKKDNVLDYEKQREVFFQVTIHDNLNSSEGIIHKVSQQVKIIVKDVNDEKPRITLLSTKTPEVEEHSENYKIENVFEAEDVDTSANLQFSIIWEESYGMKEGRKIIDKDLLENVIKIEPEFELLGDGKTNYGKATVSLVVADKKKFDWETFEILYLKIQVEDTMQEENKPGTDVALIAIIIKDINDNPPVFEPISDKFRVVEEAKENQIIGSVLATDKDGPGNNDIIYELEPINGTKEGLIKINKNTGEIKVDENKKIDADCPPTWNLYYNVIAKDPKFNHLKDTKLLSIAIDDTNNKSPRLVKELKAVSFNEGDISDKSKPIITVEATDDDRNEEHRALIYEINGEFNIELVDHFEIDKKGNVFVKKALVWTKQKQSVEVNLLIKDNNGLAGYLYLETKFTLNIKDVDDKKPVLSKNVNFDPITEADKIGTIFAKITATDDDKPCTPATKIDYKITKILNIDKDVEIKDEIFRIETKHEDEKNDCEYYGNVIINKELREYYGNFRITVTATNPPPSNNKDERDYDFKITPYNFFPPNITNPLNAKIILRLEQKIDDTLIQIDNNVLKDFTATDNQDDKFPMMFSLETIDGEDIFKFKETGKSAAQLQLKKLPDIEDIKFEIKVKAYHNGSGNSATETEKAYNVYFYDVNQAPFFDKNHTLSIEENDASYCASFPKAVDPKCATDIKKAEECEYKPKYHIFYRTELFEIPNILESKICVSQPLDYEKETLYELTIVATNGDTPPQGEPQNPLFLTINVIDVNDEAPVFDSELYLGGMSSDLPLDTEILKVSATDIDTMDTELRYEIVKGTIEISHQSLAAVKDNPFTLENKTGLIRNNFSPDLDMKGYLLFKVIVFDSEDLHNDITEVKISIITDQNKIAFTFNNDDVLVKARKLEIAKIFTNELQYNCSIDSIHKKKDSSVTNNTQTEVSTHFLNENNEPVAASDIATKIGNVDVISRLSLRFEDIGLELSGIKKNVEEEIENMENLLRTLLIVVSVVLGSLIIILIIAFILRTRSLNKRLESMTTNIFGSTKSDLNRIGTSAPGTNKHAIEANPVWNTDLNNGAQFDTISQTSGGSDLIGIEDKPEFQYSNKRRDSINPMYQNNMTNMSFNNDDDDINSLPGSNI